MRELDGGEWAVGARETPRDRDERPELAPEERIGEPGWDDDAERVTVFPGILGGDPALLPANGHCDDATIALQLEQPLVHGTARDRPRRHLVARHVAKPQEQLMRGVGVPRGAIGKKVLELELELREGVRVEELTQLDLAEELAELRRVHGQGLRAALGKGRIALVDEVPDVLEEERRGERRRGA